MVNEQISTGTQNRLNHRSNRRRSYGRPILYLLMALVLTLVLTKIGLSVGREKEAEVVSSVMPGVGIQVNWDENTKTLTVNGSGTVDESDVWASDVGSNRDSDYIKNNVENIVFGDGVEGVTGFSDMPKLTTVQFDNPNVALDPEAAFKNIPKLESVILPPGVTDDVQSNIMDAISTNPGVAVVEKKPDVDYQAALEQLWAQVRTDYQNQELNEAPDKESVEASLIDLFYSMSEMADHIFSEFSLTVSDPVVSQKATTRQYGTVTYTVSHITAKYNDGQSSVTTNGELSLTLKKKEDKTYKVIVEGGTIDGVSESSNNYFLSEIEASQEGSLPITFTSESKKDKGLSYNGWKVEPNTVELSSVTDTTGNRKTGSATLTLTEDSPSLIRVTANYKTSSQSSSEWDKFYDYLDKLAAEEGDSGNTGGSNTGGSNTGGSNTGGSNNGGNTGGGNSSGGNSSGGNTGGNSSGGNSGGNTGGSNTGSGNTSGGRGNTGGNGAATTPTTPTKPQDPDESTDTEKSDQAPGTKNDTVPSRVIDDDMVDLPEVEEDEVVSYPMFQLHLNRSDDTSIGLGWNQVPSAVGYELYSAYYNTKTEKFEDIQVTTLDAPTMTAWICKNLKKNTYYKFIVRAYKVKNKKKVYLARSRAALISTGEGGYSSIQEVSVDKPQVTLRTGRTSVIQATVVAGSREIRPRYDLRFESTDSEIATVSASGEITAEKRGTCTVYVFTQHGMYTTVEVTVK